MKRLLVLTAISMSTASCTLFGGHPGGGRPVADVYGDASGVKVPPLRILSETPPMAGDRPVPVLNPPEILPLWVPAHRDADRDMLVGGHWLFVKLRESTWAPLSPEPEGAGSGKGPSDFLPKSVWTEAIRPHRRRASSR